MKTPVDWCRDWFIQENAALLALDGEVTWKTSDRRDGLATDWVRHSIQDVARLVGTMCPDTTMYKKVQPQHVVEAAQELGVVYSHASKERDVRNGVLSTYAEEEHHDALDRRAKGVVLAVETMALPGVIMTDMLVPLKRVQGTINEKKQALTRAFLAAGWVKREKGKRPKIRGVLYTAFVKDKSVRPRNIVILTKTQAQRLERLL